MFHRNPRSSLVVSLWSTDMSQFNPSTGWLSWLIDHDWQVGSVLCALPVLIGIVILMVL